MLRCLQAINPRRCFFTTADLEDILANIDDILKKTETFKIELLSELPLFQREKQKQLLEKAYELSLSCVFSFNKKSLNRQLAFRIGNILRHYGRLCFEENYFSSKQILLLALNMQFYAIGLINECIDITDFETLEELKKQGSARPNLFEFMEDLILTTHRQQCLLLAKDDAFLQSHHGMRLFSLADIARWLGYCYQNIDRYSTSQPINDRRFEQLFWLSEELLLLIDDESNQRSLAELYYRAWPFMYQRHYPEDVEGICALYNKALVCDNSQEMKIRVANMRFLACFKAGEKGKASNYLKEALDLAENSSVKNQNEFLMANLYNNYAAYLMDPETLDPEKALQYLQLATSYAAQCRAQGYDHQYFGVYDMRMAELQFLLGDFKAAMKAVESALITLKKYPESHHGFLDKAQALRSVIDKTLENS